MKKFFIVKKEFLQLHYLKKEIRASTCRLNFLNQRRILWRKRTGGSLEISSRMKMRKKSIICRAQWAPGNLKLCIIWKKKKIKAADFRNWIRRCCLYRIIIDLPTIVRTNQWLRWYKSSKFSMWKNRQPMKTQCLKFWMPLIKMSKNRAYLFWFF